MLDRLTSPSVVAAALVIAAAVALVGLVVKAAQADQKPGVEDVARAYYAYGYARGQQDVLEGATIVGQADQYKLPPITREQLLRWREARQKATATLEAAR